VSASVKNTHSNEPNTETKEMLNSTPLKCIVAVQEGKMAMCKRDIVFSILILVAGVGTCCFGALGSIRDVAEETKVFEAYFPDSNEAGEKLDQWWKTKNTETLSPDELLEIIRQGFRRTKWNRPMIVGWVGGRYLQAREPGPRHKAIELLHHASFSPEGHVRHFVVYYGLSTIKDKSDEVLERLATLAMSNESVSRTIWGVKFTNQQKDFLNHIAPYLNSPHADVRKQAEDLTELVKQETQTRQPEQQGKTPSKKEDVDYETAFRELYETLGNAYPCFELKGIDWQAVGEEFLPRTKQIRNDTDLGWLCIELVAKLEDSHAYVMPGTASMPQMDGPRWDAGFSCIEDDHAAPAVYYVDRGGPAEKAGVKVGMVVVAVDAKNVKNVIDKTMTRMKKFSGFSSERYLRYFAYSFFMRQTEQSKVTVFEMLDDKGSLHKFKLPAEMGKRYLPRLPVPIDGISDNANVSWKMLDDRIGYIYVRRIRPGLETALDNAVAALKNARAMIVDVRGNSGGGFEPKTSHVNFYQENEPTDPNRPQYEGPMALLIDNRCISAGEGWASWFIAKKRARIFGSATAGASARKIVYELKNGLYKVRFPVKAYKGFLDRPIERRGLEPDVEVRQNAADLAKGHDTVLEAARKYLLE